MDLAHFWNTSGAYEIKQSLRFDGGSYLSRTPSAAGTLGTWTISYWAKRSKSGFNSIFNSGSVNQQGIIYMTESSDVMSVLGFNSTGAAKGWSAYGGSGRLRDFSAWYHVLIRAFSSSSGNSYDGVELKIYINGEETGTSMAGGSPSGGCRINDGQAKTIGYNAPDGNYFNGYIAEWHFVDGTALTPSSFGETDPITGAWIPKKYSGSYGTNGFYLKFDPSATNGIGHDHSGNGNNFTATGFSTSGTGTDVMSDTPTNNWCTWNPINSNATSITNGNLDFVGDTGASYARGVIGTTAVRSGKWYFESTCTTAGTSFVGVIPDTFAGTSITDLEYVDGAYSYRNNGDKAQGTGDIFSAYGNSWTANDVIGVALDLDNGAVYFSKNGTWQNSGDPTSGSSKTGAAFTSFSGGYAPMACGFSGAAQSTNFGQRSFSYTPPTGYKALNTANLPEPTIKKGSKYFDTKLYTANNQTAQTVTGLGFSPDLLWFKPRSRAEHHYLYDQVRGAGNRVSSSQTIAEVTGDNSLTAFTSDGFSLGTDGAGIVNYGTDSMVAWAWDANGAGSSNTAGTITSTVSANATAGFSIVTYTGNATAGATIGHGLGVAPKMVIAKPRSASGNWVVYHESIGNTGALTLQTTNGTATNIGYWNNTSPTSTVFSLGSSSDANQSGVTAVAYCFSEVAGYSKFGSYTGNGSTDGVFVYCGFSPRWIMWKETTVGESWFIHDTARTPYNVSTQMLRPNYNLQESTGDSVDIISNGFKFRSGGAGANFSGRVYIFAAFAEHPFKYANAR